MIIKTTQAASSDAVVPEASGVTIFPILLVNFIGTLGYSIILPFLIILVLKFGGNELIYGTIGATYSFFQLIGAPILGRWSDKFGRRKILLVTAVGSTEYYWNMLSFAGYLLQQFQATFLVKLYV